MDSADFDDYEVGEYFLYYPVGSSTDVVQKEYTFIIPQTDRYYIVIENNNWVPVNVHLRAIAGEPYAPGFKAIFAIAGLLAVACIVRRRK